jgi:acetolactate synthase-1/2/3 large subunit
MTLHLTGSHLVTRALRDQGVDTIFTLAGDHILPLLDALADEGFRLIDCRHEQAAVHMADAWGRITGGLAVCAFTTPGHAHAIPGLAHALSSESPVLNIAGSAPLRDYDRGIMQEIDQIGMARPVTKGAWLVRDAHRIPDYIALAAQTAFEGRRGPVHLTIPSDVQSQTVDLSQISRAEHAATRPTAERLADSESIRAVVSALHQAKRPLIVAGSPAAYGDCGPDLQQFIELTHLPLMTDEAARGLVSDEHPYCFGFFDLSKGQPAYLITEADVILFLGKMLDFTVGYGFEPLIAAQATVIQVDPDGLQVGRNRGAALGLVGDIGPIVRQLSQDAQNRTWHESDWLERFRIAAADKLAYLTGLAVPETPLRSMYVHKTLAPFLQPDDILVFDGGDYGYFGRAFHPARSARSWFYLPNLGMLGSSLPTAIAAKLARPQARVFCMLGDGAFGFQAMELDTAVRHGLDIVVLLGNDAAWGIDKNIQMGLYGKAVVTDLAPVRYDQVAQGLGAYGERVEAPDALAPAIERALAAGRPALLDIQIQTEISPRAQALVESRKERGAF